LIDAAVDLPFRADDLVELRDLQVDRGLRRRVRRQRQRRLAFGEAVAERRRFRWR